MSVLTTVVSEMLAWECTPPFLPAVALRPRGMFEGWADDAFWRDYLPQQMS